MEALCHACKTKGETSGAVSIIAVGVKVWDLCQAHADQLDAYLTDLLQDAGQSEPVKRRPSVVVTGDIPGYEHDAARTAIENLGYRVVGHVAPDTEVIVCGLRPAEHEVNTAREHETPAFDATEPKALARAIRLGDLSLMSGSVDDLPVMKATRPKRAVSSRRDETEEQKAERQEREAKAMETYIRWQKTEVPKRLAASAVEASQERRKKEDAEIRRLARSKMPPELTETQKIRAWARENGYEVKAKGRVPTRIREAYRHAIAGQSTDAVATG